MNTDSMCAIPSSARCPALRALAAIVCIASLPSPPARGAIVDTDRQIYMTGNNTLSMYTYNLFEIADGVTMTYTRIGERSTSPGLMTLQTGSLIYRPLGTTGRVIFENVVTTSVAGVINMAAGTTLDITNGLFRNNRAGLTNNTATGSGVSGAIHAATTTNRVLLKDVIFENNGSFGNTGVMRVYGTLNMTGGGFYNNFAAGDYGGATGMGAASSHTYADVVFDNNRARSYSGAVDVRTGTISLTNCTFTNNWAGTKGGAIQSQLASGVLAFNVDASGTTRDYLWTGNFAGNVATPLSDGDPQVVNNAPSFDPSAAGGGFYYAATSGSGRVEFNIDYETSLTIGAANATSRAHDSIASGNTSARIHKLGGGDLVLNADNSYYSGTFAVEVGRLLLGNNEAKLGGIINVASGATFGGVGELKTVLQNGNNGNLTVNAAAGSTIQVGLAGAPATGLAIEGRLSLANATLSYVAFDGTHAARLVMSGGSLATTGTNTVNLQGFRSGAYDLGNIYTDLVAGGADKLRFAVNGLVTSGSGRQTIERVEGDTPFELRVNLITDTARAMKWTGAAGGTWNDADNNWESLNAPGVTQFSALDTVRFPGDAPGNLEVVLSGNMPVSNIEVGGANNLTFTGNGNIVATPWHPGVEAETAVQTGGLGKLVKTGAGTLVFNNAGNNNFAGGIDIDGGAIEISRGEQLQAIGAQITFVESATLRVTGSSVMASAIVIGPSKIATIEVSGSNENRINGAVSGGSLVKTGAGLLALRAENTHAGTTLRAGALALSHDRALGTGALDITGDNTMVIISGNRNIGNNINFGSNNIALSSQNAVHSVLSGAINGTGIIRVWGTSTDSVLVLSGSNNYRSLLVDANGAVGAAHPNALGGPQSLVRVEPGGALHLLVPEVVAKSVYINEGATLAFDNPSRRMLVTSGSVTIENNVTIALMSRLTSGYTTLVHADGGLSVDTYSININPGPNNTTFRIYTDENNNLMLMNMNRAGNPGKDIAVSIDAMTAAVASVYSRMSENFLLPLQHYSPGDELDKGFWIKGFGSIGSYDGDDIRIGYKDSTWGLNMGIDRVFFGKYLAGVYAGYAYSDLKTDNPGCGTDSAMPHIGVYGAARYGKFYLAADIFGGSITADTKRLDDETTGSYRAALYGASIDAGLLLRAWENGVFKPSVGLHYMNYSYYDHSEMGRGAIYVQDFKTDRVESLVGLQLTHAFTTAWKTPGMLVLQANWRAALTHEQTVLNVSFSDLYDDIFEVPSDIYSRDRITIGLGIRLGLGRFSAFSFDYEYETSKDHSRHNLNASMRWSW